MSDFADLVLPLIEPDLGSARSGVGFGEAEIGFQRSE